MSEKRVKDFVFNSRNKDESYWIEVASLYKQNIKFIKDAEGASVIKENPECESCGYQRTAFNFGTYGRPDYWRCESCGHNMSVIKNRYSKKTIDTSFVGKECPECDDGTLVIKNSRYGQFYGCTNFPKCKATLKA